MLKRILLSLFSLGVLLFLLTGCDPNSYSVQDASTNLKLLDVTSGGAGKYGLTTESYWTNTDHPGMTIRCFHNRDGANYTAEPTNCETFANPSQVPDANYLLGINQGSGQVTQSVWLTKKGQMYICDHDRTFWDNATSSTTGCRPFPLPSQVGKYSILISLNSGSSIAAQSFWQNIDGTITVCNHNKDNTGFLGLGGLAFGSVQSCSQMPPVPANLFPKGLNNPWMQAVTSDSSRPWESFWQDANGIVVRCQMDHNGGFLEDETIGAATACGYWKAAQTSDVK